MLSHEPDILRRLRLIEWLKAELVSQVGRLFQAFAQASEQAIRDALASIIIACYVLGRRLGIDFAALDEVILTRLGQTIKQDPEIEKWFGDYSEFQRHLKNKR
ncbi:MazG-like family protein [Sporolituus thermophilus]|uniref:MazG-like family protein n=1 Tax=Sporolituus thermophilus DSM 23256 TaxID=1123285 RepID=A0A1G7L0W1_9FIRM|nr:MazG-like family protein [Sporolituus thermophilus]SDF42986.1 MazG-like family protein [Sporolituus thermophilus DSM 23256]